MMSKIKKLMSMRSSDARIAYLRERGMRIGEGTILFGNLFTMLFDTTRPWLIEIGKNVQITKGVTILTHGYDWATLKAVYGDVCGSAGKVKIGDNCFIGMNTTILKGTTIGDNVIVGAGSVVTGGEFPSNCVIAGSPAKVICTLDEYHNKRISAQLDEAKILVKEYFNVYNRKPEKNVLAEFFWLFEERKELTEGSFIGNMRNMNNYEKSMNAFLNSKPVFKSYDEFVDYCLSE